MLGEKSRCAVFLRCWPLHAIAIFLAFAAGFGPTSVAPAATTVRVVETWPAGDSVELGRNQNFYLRLAYDTDKPIRIWVTPLFNGKPAKVGTNTSLTYTGSGETFGWFFFSRPGDAVDEIHVMAGDGSTANTAVVATWRGLVEAGSGAASTEAEPAWVRENLARVKAAQDQAYRERMNEPTSAADMALFSGFMLAMLALGLLGFAAPAWGIWRWRGGWRVAAAAPMVVMAFVALRIAIDVAGDPTSHNLWPFEILLAGVLSVVVMAALWLARKLSGAGS